MGAFFLGYVIVSLLIVLGFFWYVSMTRKKRATQSADRIPPGFEPTAEITVDPTSGRKQRVWYNARTGQRFYESLLDENHHK